jgi:ribosomal protein S18 acetylase RimI-like enzyme
VRIRAARRDDFESVSRLLELVGRPKATAEDDCRAVFEEQITDPDSHHIVAEDAAGVVGFASLHFRSRLNQPTEEAWLPDLVVADEARRVGVGRALLDEAERRARERRCHPIQLESGYRQAEAHHMCRQFGMRDDGKFFVKPLVSR